MTEVTLSGGPLDGKTAKVEAGQTEVETGGNMYRYCESTGFWSHVEGEKPSKPVRGRRLKVEDAEESG